MGHYETARSRAMQRADDLLDAIRNDGMNASAFEGLMESYLEQPAFSNYRHELFIMAMQRFNAALAPTQEG